jgi:hypothetical protein
MALVLMACSDNGFVPEPIEVAEPAEQRSDAAAPVPESPTQPDTTPSTVLEIDRNGLPDGPLSAEVAAQVTNWFSEFLDARDRYLVGRATIDEVARYTSDRNLLAALPDEQAAYLELLELQNIVATKQFASFTNAENLTATRGRITFDDCTEVQALSVLDIVGFRWVQQQVTIADDADGWSIVQIDVVHDGEPWTTGLGCVPESFETRALEVTQSVMEEFRSYQQNPSAMSTGSFDAFDDPTVSEVFSGAIEQQRNEGISIVSPEELRYTPQGMNVPISLLGWAVVVDVCSHRPDGLLYRVDGSDEVLVDDTIEPGFSLGYRITTLLDQVSEGVTAQDKIVRVEVLNTGCW